MGNWSKFNFLYQRDLELWDSRDIPKLPPLYPINCQESCICRSFCNVFTLWSSRKNVWKLTVIQTSTVPNNSMQIFCTPKCLFCWFVLFLRSKKVTLNISIKQKCQFLDNVSICKLKVQHYNVRHTASKVNRTEKGRYKYFHVKTYNARHTASKVNRTENGRYKDFHVKTEKKPSHMTEHARIWTLSNLITLARSFGSMWSNSSSSIM